ncbi:MAG: FtsQ-type POTRA domain-containing protein [Candidatus Cloacimonetes bacterium]|nr:FtsQ-type POTRA domain-containing protein [Candidatus Cloacimonadota bacterium]
MKFERKRRGNSRYFIFMLMAIVVLVILIYTGRKILSKFDFLDTKTIAISGNLNLPEDFLRELASGFYGRNIYSVSDDEIFAHYENIVRIKSIKVRRRLPHTICIKVEERRSHCLLKTTNGILIPMDNEHVILDNKGFYPFEDAPIISVNIDSGQLTTGSVFNDDETNHSLEMLSRIQEIDADFAQRISEFYHNNGQLHLVEVNSGSRILIGDGFLEEKLKRFAFFEQNQGLAQNSTVDLRFRNQIVCYTRSGK